MAVKSFSTFTGSPRKEPFPIEINGATWQFNPSLPGALLLDFTAQADEDHPNRMAQAISDLLNFAIVAEEKEAFNAWLRDPANDVSMDLLGEIAGYLTEVYTQTPLLPGGSSPAGLPVSGPGPEALPS